MGGKGDREISKAKAPLDDPSLRSILRRARIYLDAGSPGSSHELLLPIGLGGSTLYGLPVDQHFEVLTLQLRSCQALGHSEHLAELVPRLRESPPGRRLRPGRICRRRVSSCWRDGIAPAVSTRWHAGIVNEFLEGLNDPRAVSLGVCALSTYRFDGLIREGRVDEAEDVASICIEKADRENSPLPAGIARHLLAQALKARGRTADALRLYAQAGARFAVAGDCVWSARVHLNRAALLNRIGHLPEAHAAYEEAYRHYRELSHAPSIMRSRLGLGMVSIRQGNLDAARRHLLQGWLEARRLRLPREQALALEFLGEALTLMGRPATARRALALCRRIATRIAPEGDLVAECGIREALLALTQAMPPGAELWPPRRSPARPRPALRWEESQALRLRGSRVACSAGARRRGRTCRQPTTSCRPWARSWRSSWCAAGWLVWTARAREPCPRYTRHRWLPLDGPRPRQLARPWSRHRRPSARGAGDRRRTRCPPESVVCQPRRHQRRLRPSEQPNAQDPRTRSARSGAASAWPPSHPACSRCSTRPKCWRSPTAPCSCKARPAPARSCSPAASMS